MASQALPEQAFCFPASTRWKQTMVDRPPSPGYVIPVTAGVEKLEGVVQKLAAQAKWAGKAGQVVLLPDNEVSTLQHKVVGELLAVGRCLGA